MFDAQDRRSALLRLFAGAAAVAGARGGASAEAHVDAEKTSKPTKPTESWEGALHGPVYTPVGEGDTVDYLITAQGGDGGVMVRKKHREIPMSDAELFSYMQAKSGGDYSGQICMGLQGMNWRLFGVDYAAAANTWRLQVRVCESNPDARPDTGAAGRGWVDRTVATGCNCGCDARCYQCGRANGYAERCGKTYAEACPNES